MIRTPPSPTCSAAACIGGSANTNWRLRITPKRFGTIRTRRWPIPAADAYRGLKLFDLAISDHTEAIRLRPDVAAYYNNRGNDWHDLKNDERAIADYDLSIKVDPSYATAYYNRGNARLASGDNDGAAADFEQAARLNPAFRPATDRVRQVELEAGATTRG